MPPRKGLPGLPPLPHRANWNRHLKSSLLRINTITQGGASKPWSQRLVLARPDLAEEFVRGIKMREGEVVLNVLDGPGVLTRSLLDGGRSILDQESRERAARWRDLVEARGADDDSLGWDKNFPPYSGILPDMVEGQGPLKSHEDPAFSSTEGIVEPKLVVAVESSVEILATGLGMTRQQVEEAETDPRVYHVSKRKKSQRSGGSLGPAVKYGSDDWDAMVFKSGIDDRLAYAPVSVMYRDALPKILAHPIVQEALPVYDESKTGVERTMRPWRADPPPITIMATLPTGPQGEAMSIDWLQSPGGSFGGPPGWIWKYGRIRMALLVDIKTYDRIMATPGPVTWQSHTVKIRALWNPTPLPPYFHTMARQRGWKLNEDGQYVPSQGQGPVNRHAMMMGEPSTLGGKRANAGRPRGSKDTRPRVPGVSGREVRARQLAEAKQQKLTPPDWVSAAERTTADDVQDGDWTRLTPHATAPEDFYPLRPPKKDQAPQLVGLLLEPRADPLMRAGTKDMWDYILRRSFTRGDIDALTAFKSVAFGMEGLKDKIEAKDSPFPGEALDTRTKINLVSVEQWQRVVEVFAAWPFRPTDAELIEAHYGLMMDRSDTRGKAVDGEGAAAVEDEAEDGGSEEEEE